MLKLKKINLEDWEKEYDAMSLIPENENGFANEFYGVKKDEFRTKTIPTLLANSEGKGLKEGYVPDTYFFLWADEEIVGLFKIRHYLNDFLANGPGHIGFCVLSKYRGRGYATEGLKLAIGICKDLIKEDEIYMSVNKDNIASLKVQQNNGAYIVKETEDKYLTRIKKVD